MPSHRDLDYYRTIIQRPLVTEKSMEQAELEPAHKYHFRVHPDANKIEIRRAIESLFNVKVEKVNTMMVRGKVKRRTVRHREGHTERWKKAIVTLAPGDRIEVIAG
jgi:large subunit ribosomal protein L23